MPARKTEKSWRDALMLAVNRLQPVGNGDERVALALLAEKCVSLALEGDLQAMKEIGDRLDGKAHQSLDVTVDDVRSLTPDQVDERIAALMAKASERRQLQ